MKQSMLKLLAAGVPTARRTIDRKTGRFLAANGGWAVTQQDCILPLALLYTTPGTDMHGDRAVFDLARRGGDALCDAQDGAGQFEFVKVDGSRWGKIHMPWTIVHWCEAYALLRERFDRAARQRWERGLTLAYEGLARTYERPVNHNIPTWNGMSLVRGAQVFGREAWHAVGRRLIEHNIAHLHPHGYWPEGDGPTYGYNRVYIHALGLYHAFTGDRQVIPALRKAVTFQTTFCYPDGSGIAAIDGRQRYHAQGNAMGWPGYSLSAEGRRLIERSWPGLKQKHEGLPSPHLASTCQYLPDDASTASLLVDRRRARTVYRKSALVRRQGAWTLCVSGYGTPPASRAANRTARWIMTPSNCLSVWHDKLGVIIGGGHSKHAPLFATFDLWQDGAQRVEPDRAVFNERNGEDVARLHYGELSCVLRLRPRGDRLDITFELPARTARLAQVRAGFVMLPEHGSKLRWTAAGRPKVDVTNTLDPQRAIAVAWTPGDGYRRRKVSGAGWTLERGPRIAALRPRSLRSPRMRLTMHQPNTRPGWRWARRSPVVGRARSRCA